MLIQNLLKKYFPRSIYLKIKSNYRKLKFKLHRKISENEFKNILINQIGIKKGSMVFVHSSMDNLFLNFPYNKVIDILLEVVGEEGTLLFPTTHFHERAEEWVNRGEVFDVRKTPSAMGMISELARRKRNAVRSLHPTNSIVAIGKEAVALTNEHHLSVYPCGEQSPFYKLINYNALVIGLGVGTVNLSFVHTVEDVMKDKFPVTTRKSDVFSTKVKDYDGNIVNVNTLVGHPDTGPRDVEGFVKKYIPKDICIDFKYKGIKFFKANSKELFSQMVNLAEKGITIYK